MLRRRTRLVDRFDRYDAVCEIGIGQRPGVARALADRGLDVRATDIVPRAVPDSVRFETNDVRAASRRSDPGSVYAVELVYALACPPSLHRPLCRVGRRVNADVRFTTLADEEPAVPAERESVGDGIVVFRPRE